MPPATHESQKAFTLLEIVVSTAILAFGLMTILVLFPVGVKASRYTGEMTTASLIGQTVMEELKRAGYDALSQGIFSQENGDDPALAQNLYTDQSSFEWEYRVAPLNAAMVPPLLSVTLGVYWPAAMGNPGNRQNQKNIIFRRYFARW